MKLLGNSGLKSQAAATVLEYQLQESRYAFQFAMPATCNSRLCTTFMLESLCDPGKDGPVANILVIPLSTLDPRGLCPILTTGGSAKTLTICTSGTFLACKNAKILPFSFCLQVSVKNRFVEHVLHKISHELVMGIFNTVQLSNIL